MVLLLMLKRALSIPSKRSRSRRVCVRRSQKSFFALKMEKRFLRGKNISSGSGEFPKKRSHASSKKKRSPPPPPLFFRKGKEDKEDKGAREKYF